MNEMGIPPFCEKFCFDFKNCRNSVITGGNDAPAQGSFQREDQLGELDTYVYLRGGFPCRCPGEEIEKKYLSRRESARIGIVAVYAMNRIKSNFENNKQIRTDDFFERDPIVDRSAADEILEGTLIAAKNEHEEKKLKYYGNLVANIAFHPEIDRYHANYLLRVSERLSYRQICILAIFNRKSNYRLISKISGLKTLSSQNDKIILREIREMKNSDLLIPTNNYSTSVVTAANLTPSTNELIEAGKTIVFANSKMIQSANPKLIPPY